MKDIFHKIKNVWSDGFTLVELLIIMLIIGLIGCFIINQLGYM
jgi:prepilin-type N-terminal cleavage/methylation domain-containing protein